MSIKLLNRSGIIFIGFAMLLQGCVTAEKKSADMRNMLQQNRPALALANAEMSLAKDTTGVMENMNVGLLRRLNRDYQGSNAAFEVAKKRISELYSTSVTEQIGAVLVNDESISFQGDRYEQVLVHLYMASNYLSMGDLDSARVELLQSQVKLDEWGEPKDETPFMRYFSGILYEMLGEEDSATVSYRKAVDAYRITKEKHGLNVPLTLKHDLLRMLAKMKLWGEYKQYKKQFSLPKYKAPKTKGKGELVVVFANGITPQRGQKTFETYSTVLALNVKIAIPDYKQSPRILNRVGMQVNGKSYPLETVSNIDGLARAALSENMPIITTRAIARAVAKKKLEKEAEQRGGALGQFAMFVVNHVTEIADTRCWNTLPQEFQMTRVFLPQGQHDVLIDVIGPAGNVVDTIRKKVNIKAGAKSIIFKRWTAPEYKELPKAVAAK